MRIGYVTLLAITVTTILMPYLSLKDLPPLDGLPIFKWDADLATWQGTSIAVPELATKHAALFHIKHETQYLHQTQ